MIKTDFNISYNIELIDYIFSLSFYNFDNKELFLIKQFFENIPSSFNKNYFDIKVFKIDLNSHEKHNWKDAKMLLEQEISSNSFVSAFLNGNNFLKKFYFTKYDFAIMLIDKENLSSILLYFPDKNNPQYAKIMGSFFYFFFKSNLQRLNCLFLHAACISRRHKGYLFFAPSGGGKTTLSAMAKKSNEYEIVSDESILIRKENNHFFAFDGLSFFSLPFTSHKKVEIYKIYLLEKHIRTDLSPISFLEMLLNICKQTHHFYPLIFNDKTPQYKAQFLFSLLKTIPFFKLEFELNNSFLTLLIE